MAGLSGVALWWRHRKEEREDVRLSQDVLRSTLEQLHTELDELHKEYQRNTEELRAELIELSTALAECDRERVRLMIRVKGLERGYGNDVTFGDDQSSSS